MENQNNLNPAIIKASFDLEASKKGYQKMLQKIASIEVTRDNVNDDLTKEAREISKYLTDKKDADSKPFLEAHKAIMTAYNGLNNPIKAETDRIAARKKIVADEINEEKRIQREEQEKITRQKTAIVDFINRVALLISDAKTDTDIVSIEKLLGSEKTKTSVYGDFISDLANQCEGLRPKIKEQKEQIRNLQDIEAKQKEAMETGDIDEVTKLEEEKEYITQVIAETGIRIHEKAFELASEIEVLAPDIEDTAPKGRSNWKWRVDNITLLSKKMPHLVKLVPDEEAIDELLKNKKTDGSLKDKEEESFNGITFFNDKTYRK